MNPVLLVALLAGLAACSRPAADTETLTPEAASRVTPAATVSAAADTSGWRAFFEGSWLNVGNDSNNPFYYDCGQHMVVQFDSTQVMCIEDNQIVVRVQWRLDEAAGRADLLLVEPDDLGAGGARLPWSEMDTGAPLATLVPEPGEGRTAELVWHGFPHPRRHARRRLRGVAREHVQCLGLNRIGEHGSRCPNHR